MQNNTTEKKERLGISYSVKARLIVKCSRAKKSGQAYYLFATLKGVEPSLLDAWINEFDLWEETKDITMLQRTTACVKFWEILLQKKIKWKSILWDRIRIRISR